MHVFGQLCGLAGTVVTVIQPQMKTKQQMLICTMLVNGLNGLNFALIGETGSSVYLCLVAVGQSLTAIFHHRRNAVSSALENILFFALYMGLGVYGMVSSDGFVWAMNRRNILEMLPTIGALMLMLSVCAKSEQRTRLFLLLNGAAWLIYTACIGATAFFSAAISVVSSGAALWKYRRV